MPPKAHKRLTKRKTYGNKKTKATKTVHVPQEGLNKNVLEIYNEPCTSKQADLRDLQVVLQNNAVQDSSPILQDKHKIALAKEARKKQDYEDKMRRQRRLEIIATKAQSKRKSESDDVLRNRLIEKAEWMQARREKIARRQSTKDQSSNRQDIESIEIQATRCDVEEVIIQPHVDVMATEARAKRRNVRLVKTHLIAARDHSTTHYLGQMNIKCKHCLALHFLHEKLSANEFSNCCNKGDVQIPPSKPYPDLLKLLMTKQHQHSNNFLKNIRIYNSAMSFASIGANIDFPPGHGPYCFRIHGQMYHKISSIYTGSAAKFGQLYFLESSEALACRTNVPGNDGCIPELFDTLDALLRNVNPFAQAYRFMREIENEEQERATILGQPSSAVIMQIIEDRRTDLRRYNIPTANEVAVVFRSNDGQPPQNRDIRIHLRGGKFLNINTSSPNCDPLSYVLLFPNGEPGWQTDMESISRQAKGCKRTRVTMRQYYSYKLSVREGFFNPVLNAGKLTQQFIVDAFVKIEGERLRFIQNNQAALRVERYQGLLDHLQNEAVKDDARLGKLVILPTSFTGGPRAMRQHYQDAMAIVTKFGKPDLFITFTCNARWPEIHENLKAWQSSENRSDLIARVFHLKLKELMKDIKERHVLGVPLAVIHTIEFQKRGLPHAHILIILRDEDKPREPEHVDRIVCAEFPDRVKEPALYELVSSSMVHGPCGVQNPRSPCMRDGKCTKRFPKDFRAETDPNVNGYPLYRRRDNGQFQRVRNADVDNRFVVPYNKWLLQKYRAHINVEICSSVKSVKYICGYVHKGHDCATVSVETVTDGVLEHDEVQSYIDSRYVSAPEAMWRIFGFKMHDQTHHIIRLAVHLPNQQNVYFMEGQEEAAANRANSKQTTLTAWFKLNISNPEAKRLLYVDIPQNYVFNQNYEWTPRKRGEKSIISRMYTVSIRDEERYYLRLLLLHVKGATCFNDIRTVNGVLYDTFKNAAGARNLLTDDKEWHRCLEEAAVTQMPVQLRGLFVSILIFCEVARPDRLWNEFQDHLMEDYARYQERDLAVLYALADIQSLLQRHGSNCKEKGLPTPPADIVPNKDDVYCAFEERIEGDRCREQLNKEQLEVFDVVMNAISHPFHSQRCFFLDGPGGTGKTFVYNTILSVLRGKRDTAIAVAWTGIAAMLLKGGCTVHSMFKLPVPLIETSTCNLKEGQRNTERIKRSKLIIWDEATMAPALALDAVDKALRDILRDDRPFGGKAILLGGDFRQCLPVVPRGHRTQIVEACIKNSSVWKNFVPLRLTTNMRANANELEFAEYTRKMGDGLLTNTCGLPRELIEIPSQCMTDNIVAELFGNSDQTSHEVVSAILCPKNEDCLQLNELILKEIPGVVKTYCSIDNISDEDANRDNFTVEFLNSLTPSGMPPHKLTLKIGAVIMLLRNLNISAGLCNGTRLIVRNMQNNYLDAEIAVGTFKGHRVYIPRIDLAPCDTNLPFILKRRQFPIRLAYAMTINKAQGQTLDTVGIYLPKPVFAHGQLYVAFSRAKSMDSVRIQLCETPEQGLLVKKKSTFFTKNIVYKEVLQ